MTKRNDMILLSFDFYVDLLTIHLQFRLKNFFTDFFDLNEFYCPFQSIDSNIEWKSLNKYFIKRGLFTWPNQDDRIYLLQQASAVAVRLLQVP